VTCSQTTTDLESCTYHRDPADGAKGYVLVAFNERAPRKRDSTALPLGASSITVSAELSGWATTAGVTPDDSVSRLNAAYPKLITCGLDRCLSGRSDAGRVSVTRFSMLYHGGGAVAGITVRH
jgi:hypothetical protein